MVVDHGEEVYLAELSLVHDARTVHAVGLPEVVRELGFESAAVFGKTRVLFDPLALEQPVQAVLRGNPVGIDDAPGAGDLHEYRQAHTEILLAQGNEGSLKFPVQGAAGVAVPSWLGFEGLEPFPRALVDRQPSKHRRAGDGRPRRSREFPLRSDNLADPGFLFATAHAFPAHQRADDPKAKKGDGLASFLVHGTPPGTMFTAQGGSVAASLR